MERAEKALKMSNQQFKRIIGTTRPVFQKMMNVLEIAHNKLHEFGGKPPDLTVGDKLFMTLQYYREYRTMESIAVEYPFTNTCSLTSGSWRIVGFAGCR
ncbi:MAG: transposase family protein [Planctomycetaceae bacterium]|nr:transposase family protein [Planctomycetaceae bacterium]